MDKQELQNVFAEFLKWKQGAALVAENLSALIDSEDTVLFSKAANETQPKLG